MLLRLSNINPAEVRHVDSKKDEQHKFFFVFEGEKTEKIYFEEVYKKIQMSDIGVIPEIIFFDRILKNRSNQLYVVENMSLYFNERQIVKDEKKILEKIVNDYTEDDKKTYEDLIVDLKKCAEKWDSRSKISDILQNSSKVEEVLLQLKALKKLGEYNEEIDEIWVIIDRDKESFTINQFDKAVTICCENGFELGVTNPNFEFYLLLHLDSCQLFTKTEISENRRVSSKRRYLEDLLNSKLHEIDGSTYKKNRYKAAIFVDKIPCMLANAELYNSEVNAIKNGIGSTIPKVIKKLKLDEIW